MAKDPRKVRNVGVLGHGGVGKTMLLEHILHNCGVTNRLGSIEDGNTVCDYLEEEQERQQSIAMKLTHVEYEDVRIHLVDHPGYADFLGEVAASVPLLDALIIVVDATTGPQVGTDNAWKYAERYNVPRAFFINKLDRDHTSYQEAVNALREAYGPQCAPLVAPVGAAADLSSVVNVAEDDVSALGEDGAAMKESLMEVVAETDDELTMVYLEEGTLAPDDFRKGLLSGILSGKVIPILGGSVAKNLGLKELLDVVVNSFPTPLNRQVVGKGKGGSDVEVKVSADEPFLGQVFRSVVDPFVGHLTFFRVLSGTLSSDGDFYNVTTQTKERTGKIYLVNGKEQVQTDKVVPGDLAAMTKLKNTHFGDTLAASSIDMQLPGIELPQAMVKLAIEPKSRSDADKIGEALNRLAEEDPTFNHYRDTATGEHVVRGMGDQQLDILLSRLKNKFNVEAETRTPRVAYRETIKGTAEVQGKHKKQTGGHGQYGDVHIRVKPNERGAGYEFVDSIVGGVVPKQYIPHVDKGSQDALEKGVISGNPVVDIVVELFFGSYHNVDSSEMAFKLAASKAIQKGIRDAKPCLLEPIMEIAVTVPEEYMGDINGDLNSRRGRILGMDAVGGGRQVIRALVPEAEILRYSTDLRSMTQGRGSYELKLSHYDEMPDHAAKDIIAAYEKSRVEEE